MRLLAALFQAVPTSPSDPSAWLLYILILVVGAFGVVWRRGNVVTDREAVRQEKYADKRDATIDALVPVTQDMAATLRQLAPAMQGAAADLAATKAEVVALRAEVAALREELDRTLNGRTPPRAPRRA